MIRGSLVPNITFFAATATWISGTQWHMRWMFEHGADGLFLTGSYGSGPLMTLNERIAVFAAAKQVAAGFAGKVVLPHVGCIDTKSTIALAKAAERLVWMPSVQCRPSTINMPSPGDPLSTVDHGRSQYAGLRLQQPGDLALFFTPTRYATPGDRAGWHEGQRA